VSAPYLAALVANSCQCLDLSRISHGNKGWVVRYEVCLSETRPIGTTYYRALIVAGGQKRQIEHWLLAFIGDPNNPIGPVSPLGVQPH
jgi:hypothetical protein